MWRRCGLNHTDFYLPITIDPSNTDIAPLNLVWALQGLEYPPPSIL